MDEKRTPSTAAKSAFVAVAALALMSCQVPDFAQFNSPKLDVSAMVPPDPNEFARAQRALAPVGAADLVDGSGACAGGPATAQAQAQASDSTGDAPAPPAAPAVPRGVALEMTECEVVRAAGPPAEVQVSANPQGERAVTLIYATPERPIYRFVAGRLKVVERGAEPPPPEPVSKKPKKTSKRRAS